MKSLIIVSVTLCMICSCGDADNANNGNVDLPVDSMAKANSNAVDTITHPTGVDNSSAISTDTAAINVQNTIDKADSIAKQKKK